MNRRAPTIVCSADELCPGDVIDQQGLRSWPLLAVVLEAGGPGQPCYVVRVLFDDDGADARLLPAQPICVRPGPLHTAFHYANQAAAARALPHNRRTP